MERALQAHPDGCPVNHHGENRAANDNTCPRFNQMHIGNRVINFVHAQGAPVSMLERAGSCRYAIPRLIDAGSSVVLRRASRKRRLNRLRPGSRSSSASTAED